MSREESKLEMSDLVKGLVGVTPIPVAGEICLSMFFGKVFEDKGELDNPFVYIPAALLTRMALYTSVYSGLFDYFS
tara:strand:- start:655 stop:882 length:228 start_codon:yes stop_codon:yes gene_type:complete